MILLLVMILIGSCVSACTAQEKVCTQEAVADIVFLVDGSWSIGKKNFPQIQDFLHTLVNSFSVSPDQVRIGLAQYSNDSRTEFLLNTYQDKQEVLQYIKTLPYKGGGTMTGAGLDFILKEQFTEQAGSRASQGVPQIAVVITDGRSQDDVEPHADDLRRQGIILYAIGIKDADEEQLRKIGNEPHDQHVYSVSDFSALQGISQNIVKVLCTTVEETKRRITQASLGCSVHIAVGFDITKRPSRPALFSGQSQLKQQLPEIISKISSLDNICCGPNSIIKTKIAFSLVDEKGEELAYFPFEEYSSDVVKKVTKIETNKDTFFNAQFLESFQKVFRNSAAKVKVLIIFSDGLDAPVEKLELEADHLRDSGVSALVTVSLEGAQNAHELQMVEFGRSFGYKKPFSISVYNIEDAIWREIHSGTERECCAVMCKCTGQEGMRGAHGPPGPKGIPGLKGHMGYPGEEGGPGHRGPPGANGIQGVQGCQGGRGQKGARGYAGDVGEDGEHGLNGVHGEQGATGVAGTSGEQGEPGSPGRHGIRGDPGVKGRSGLKGDTGEPGADNILSGQKGNQGNRGKQGQTGLDGEVGRPGDPGNPGSAGRRGPPGSQGLRGDPGEAGLRGSAGLPGPQGKRGPIGQPAPTASPGLPGFSGPPGPTGPKGSRGSPGQKGQKGQPGDPGIKGAIGPVGARGPPGHDGKDGYGAPGLKGSKGETGFPGYPGLQGEDGIKGHAGGPGKKGNQGRVGKAGHSGPQGDPGTPGMSGHRGPRGTPGSKMDACELVNYVRDNCACCLGQENCPAYPTELVIALDMSEDVTAEVFEKMRATVHHLLEDISIAESNCPKGARVAVISFSSSVKYLIRFSDYHRKKHLLAEVNNIALKLTSSHRNIGAAMSFVARHVFKRTRKGLLMQKVAVFITNGASQDIKAINTAVLELKAYDIHPAVIAFRNAPNVLNALEADDTQSFIVKLVKGDQELKPQLTEVQKCVICYDHCKNVSSCSDVNKAPAPIQVDLDLAVLVDGSHSVQAEQYEGMKKLLGSLVEQIAVSSHPSKSDHQARVALYHGVSSSYVPTAGQVPVQQEFDFVRYQDSSSMKSHIFQSMQKLGGSSGLGHAVEWVITKSLLTAKNSRKNKMVLVIVGGETSYWDRAQLEFASRLARCQGVVLFTVSVGDSFNSSQVEEFTSLPLEQHMIHLGEVKQEEREYAIRFLRAFLGFLKRGINTYPVPSEQLMCQHFQQQTDQWLTNVLIESIPLPTSNYNPPATNHSFYQTGNGQTETFYETGHGGQENTGRGDSDFDILLQREDATPLQDVCTLKQDEGRCRKFVLKWYYDTVHNKCLQFWYGGCDGNGNRFKNKEDCEARCLRSGDIR